MILSGKFHQLPHTHKEAIIAFTLAIAAAILIKVPTVFGIQLDENESFYFLNMSLFVLPLLTGYFVWKRSLDTRTIVWLTLAFAIAGVFANIYPFDQGGNTEALAALHMPVALWLIVGVTFAGGRWGQVDGRMEFIRFSGELFIYYVLLALGGIVLTGCMALIFGSIDIDIEPFFESWLLPCGAAAAVIIASWLVETQKGITGNIAPLLAKLFTPLFTIVLITYLGTLIWTGRGLEIERNVLIAFDMILLVVLALLLYSISARDPKSPPGIFDVIQVVLLVCALLADAVAMWAISQRITELGWTPNRVTGLGINVILLVNLAGSSVLYVRFLGGQQSFRSLEQWQTNYLPVYSLWAAFVVIVFPILFGFD